MVLIDKASGNEAITCKRFYVLKLLKELGVTIGGSINNKNFVLVNTTNENYITDKHKSFLNRYRLSIKLKNFVYPVSTGNQNCVKLQQKYSL